MASIAVVSVLLAACAHVPPATAPATASATGPQQRFDDDLLERLVGDWKLARKIRGKIEQNRASAEWVLQHRFLELHMRDAADPPQYEALVLIGYDSADSRYVAHWCDTWGGGYSAKGFGKRSGDSIEFEFDYPDGPFFNTFTWHASTQSWTFLMENGKPGGKRSLFGEDTLERP